MQAVIEELVRTTHQNPFSYIAMALVAILMGLYLRPAVLFITVFAVIAFATQPSFIVDFSELARNAFTVIHVAMVVSLIMYVAGVGIAWTIYGRRR